MRRTLLLFAAACWLFLAWSVLAETKKTQPNIVVLYADDAGYADFGFQPNCQPDMKALTPHIDSIAANGARFSQAYMSGAVCSPSRAGLMTGRYQQRFGFQNNLPPGTKDGLALNETFGTRYLKQLGYTTGLVGKWHLGYPAEFHPNKRGFDWFYGLLQGSRGYYPIDKPSNHRVIQENGEPTKEQGYITDRFGDAACRFIKVNKDEPFYLFVSFTAPHSPLHPRKGADDRLDHIDKKRRKNYAGLVVALDDNVGKILDQLKASGVADKTIVLFTNDNGGATHTGANNHPLRDGKGSSYEGGTRVPWAMSWPGKIQPGSVIDEPVIALDMLPTFVSAAGGEIDPAWKLDGTNLVPRITGKQAELPDRTLYWKTHRGAVVREGDWRLIVHEEKAGGKTELYNIKNDIGETTNLADKHPGIVESLRIKLEQWSKDFPEPRWGPGSEKRKGGQ